MSAARSGRPGRAPGLAAGRAVRLAPDHVAGLRKALLAWYRRVARALPWRRTRDPYRIWVSEVLLQQTRVETAVPYYRRFVRVFPDVAALAAAPRERVLKLWEGLGYYRRAVHLHAAARIIVRRHGGRMPRTAAEWSALPGIGRYTAGAIASIAAGERVPAVDGNVQRVLARVLRIQSPLEDRATRAALWELAGRLVPRAAPGAFNQALMELGARLCTPRRPRCERCPLRRRCAARAAGLAHVLPRRRPHPDVPRIDAVAAAIERGGRYLLVRRPEGGLLGGLWTLPGTGVTDGQPHAELLRVHVAAALGLAIEVGAAAAVVTHTFSHRRLRLHVYGCRIAGGGLAPAARAAARWVAREQMGALPCAALDRKVFARLGV